MLRPRNHPSTVRSTIAVGLRVGNVERAAEFYQTIGFRFVMAVPGEKEGWLFCLLRYGTASILLAPLDRQEFPRSHHPWRGLGLRIDLTVPDIGTTYGACVAAGCKITADPVQEIWGDQTFSCLDPFGYGWRFTQVGERRALNELAQATAMWS
jgi:uncharacterized glyoxalase superfamily protein PhnB